MSGQFAQHPYGGMLPYSNSSTSRQAALSQMSSAPNKRQKVYWFIAQSGSYGSIDEEGQNYFKMGAQTYTARRGELCLMNLIFDSGAKRKTSKGQDAIVWIALDFKGSSFPKYIPKETLGDKCKRLKEENSILKKEIQELLKEKIQSLLTPSK